MKDEIMTYSSVLEMVKATSNDQEFIEEFERMIKQKEAVAALVETLTPAQRMYVFMFYCPSCGEKRPAGWIGNSHCPKCLEVKDEK